MAVQALLLTPIIAPLVRWFIPPLMGALTALFRTRLGLIFVSAMLWMGLNFTTVNIVLGPLIDQLNGLGQTNLGGNQYGIWITQWAGVLQFDRCITAISSAYITRVAVANTRLFLTRAGGGGATP